MILKVARLVPVLFSISILVSCAEKSPGFHEYESNKPLQEVMEDAEFAITEKNFRITGYLHIGKAIRERGYKGFPSYEMILFCNLSYAREMLTIDPSFVNYCPQHISVREQDQKIIVGTALLPEKTGNRKMDDFAVKINTILRDIVKYAAEEDPFLLDKEDAAQTL